jgi:hypothetical protein
MNDQLPSAPPKQALGSLPFAVGGASFIPLLGIPLGIVAVVWGLLTKRKGRIVLILLGTGGILFSVLLYASLFYFGFVRRGGVYDHLRAELAQTTLQSLVKEIEFFKLQKGTYPTTLEELLPPTANSFVSVYDPTQMHLRDEKSRMFYYELQSDKEHYYLLSVGPDRVPFTSDDIVPQFSPQETARMGLRIRNQ